MRLLVCLLLAAPAIAQPVTRSPMITAWEIQPASETVLGEKLIADGEYILKQTLLPKGLARLVDPVQIDAGRWGVEPGTQLLEVSIRTQGRLYCSLGASQRDKKTGEMKNRASDTICLLDSDSDGRFEAAFQHYFSVRSVPMVQGETPKKTESIDAGYAVLRPDEIAGSYFVAVKYDQYFNIYGNRMLFTTFGGLAGTAELTEFGRFKSAGPYPVDKQVLGAEFAIIAAEPKAIRVSIRKSMPLQAFGIQTYTTYRIY